MTERWATVDGWPHYEVSDRGRVRRETRILACPPTRRKYKALILCHEGRRKTASVHALVAAHFIGPRPEGKQIAHLDGNRLNNRFTNLIYATPRENNDHKYQHRTILFGEANPRAVLTDETVAELRRTVRPYVRGHSYSDHARRLGVTTATICRAVQGTTWQTASANARGMERVR